MLLSWFCLVWVLLSMIGFIVLRCEGLVVSDRWMVLLLNLWLDEVLR